jgi:heme/copper-type cytochrome/quinol oxidase subunit 3
VNRKSFWFAIVAFLAGVALTQWVNVRVLCRGVPAEQSRCGGFALYAVDELMLLAPTLAIGFAAIWMQRGIPTRESMWLVVALTLLLGIALEFRPVHHWPNGGGTALGSVLVFVITRAVVRRTHPDREP